MNPILDKILTDTYTFNQLSKRVRILKQYLLIKIFQGSTQDIDESLRIENQWLVSLGNDFYGQFTTQNVYHLFTELEKEIKKLQPLIIYVPFEPEANQLNQIGNYLRKNYGEKFIFDLKYDPQLIGGCALVWKGIYKDFSLRSRIAQEKDQILERFKQTITTTS